MSGLGRQASADMPIVVLDLHIDGDLALIAGRTPGTSHDSYFYAPVADLRGLKVDVPSRQRLIEEAPSGVYLKQMHYLAQLSKGMSLSPSDWATAWVVAGYFKQMSWL